MKFLNQNTLLYLLHQTLQAGKKLLLEALIYSLKHFDSRTNSKDSFMAKEEILLRWEIFKKPL